MKNRWLFAALAVAVMLSGIYLVPEAGLQSGRDYLVRLFNNLDKTGGMKQEVSNPGNKEKTGSEVLYWMAPMDPNYRRDKPGKSPMGMELVPVYADSENGPGTVTISPEVVNNLGVRTAGVKKGPLPRQIDTVGYIGFDESRISHVHLRAEGWINYLAINTEGDRVKKGQLLFTLYSPTLVNAQEEYLQAVASDSRGLARASRERLVALGLEGSQIDKIRENRKPTRYVATYASQSGVVSALNVRQGMYIKPETEIMSLANLDTIWIEAEVFERQANWVKPGQPAEARIPAMPGRTWNGKVDYVYPELDPVTRTLRVRLRFENPGELLKPNMYADVSILSEPSGPVIHIPREALINDGKVSRVVLALGEGRFRAKRVTSGMESGDRIEIIEGLDTSDEVVVSAQFLIDSEASLNASFQRMEPVSKPDAGSPHVHPEGKGTINSINRETRTINISHGPIEALNWPEMTMDMDVAPDVDLDLLQAGETVGFHLGKNESGDYIINRVSPVHKVEGDHD